jgi:hypothetical protein
VTISAYQNIGFSYLAIKLGDSPQIVRGRVFMNTSPRTVEIPHFKTSHVCAGYCPLKDFSDVRDLINQLATGTITTANGPLLFMPPPGGMHGAVFTPLHPDDLTTQTRTNVLTIMGGQTESIRQPEIDWESRQARGPMTDCRNLPMNLSSVR